MENADVLKGSCVIYILKFKCFVDFVVQKNVEYYYKSVEWVVKVSGLSNLRTADHKFEPAVGFYSNLLNQIFENHNIYSKLHIFFTYLT